MGTMRSIKSIILIIALVITSIPADAVALRPTAYRHGFMTMSASEEITASLDKVKPGIGMNIKYIYKRNSLFLHGLSRKATWHIIAAGSFHVLFMSGALIELICILGALLIFLASILTGIEEAGHIVPALLFQLGGITIVWLSSLLVLYLAAKDTIRAIYKQYLHILDDFTISAVRISCVIAVIFDLRAIDHFKGILRKKSRMFTILFSLPEIFFSHWLPFFTIFTTKPFYKMLGGNKHPLRATVGTFLFSFLVLHGIYIIFINHTIAWVFFSADIVSLELYEYIASLTQGALKIAVMFMAIGAFIGIVKLIRMKVQAIVSRKKQMKDEEAAGSREISLVQNSALPLKGHSDPIAERLWKSTESSMSPCPAKLEKVKAAIPFLPNEPGSWGVLGETSILHSRIDAAA